MRKSLFTCFVTAYCLLATSSFAQGNLQFNQVLVIEVAISGTQAITVPAGKVWKIESVGMGSSGTSASLFLRNSSAVNIAYFSSPSSATSVAYPFWLSSGFTGAFFNLSPSFRCVVSIIEFNVLP